jgi:hypothetical protein
LDKLNLEILHKIFLYWFNTNFENIELRICKEKRKIKKFWMADHDLRFSQVLINMGYLDNIPGIWYFTEDDDVLIHAGLEPREVVYWGQNFDANMNRLPSTKWILIKDMSLDHIKAVIAFMGERLPIKYKDIFAHELELRKTS